MALDSRKLDVAASPYDASSFGLEPIPVETSEGRRMYRDEQLRLMKQSEPIRQRLLDAYKVFMTLAFDQRLLGPCTASGAAGYVAPERLASTAPAAVVWSSAAPGRPAHMRRSVGGVIVVISAADGYRSLTAGETAGGR